MTIPAAADCSHRPPCPGCPRLGEAGLAQVARTALARLAERAGLAGPRVIAGERFAFRRRVRLMVRGRPGAPKLGIFQAASHRIVDIPNCRVHHPLVNDVARAVRGALHRTGIEPYADAPHRGQMRALQVTVEQGGRRAQVVLVGNSFDPGELTPLVDPLREALGKRLQGLWWNGNPQRTNVILGRQWRHLAGEPVLRERVAGIEVCIPPGAFVQSHASLAERVVEAARAAVPEGATVAEFYAGCGPIGLGLLGRARAVRFNEIDRNGLEGLGLGVALRPEHERARAVIVPGAAGERLALLDGADCVVVDPPRRGLDAPLLEALAARPPSRLVYVSCGLRSFERDAERLLAGGRMRLVALEAFELFPHTEHVETLAVFEAA